MLGDLNLDLVYWEAGLVLDLGNGTIVEMLKINPVQVVGCPLEADVAVRAEHFGYGTAKWPGFIGLDLNL